MSANEEGKAPDAASANGSGSGEQPQQQQQKSEQATVEDMINQLEGQVQKLEAEKRDLQDRLLRTAADFDNWRKRAKKEQDEAAAKGREALLKDMLPVIDNLERALKHAGDDPLAQGVRMVEKQLLSTLEKFGVTRFSAVGQPFDPALHDAIQQVETTEHAPNTVAQEFASGYLVSGRLLRAAMVAVAKPPAGAAGDGSESGGGGGDGGGGASG
jgi:molecular chaperone GrpE